MSTEGSETVGRSGQWLPMVLALLVVLPILLFLWVIFDTGIATSAWFWVATTIGVALLLIPSVVILRVRTRQQ